MLSYVFGSDGINFDIVFVGAHQDPSVPIFTKYYVIWAIR